MKRLSQYGFAIWLLFFQFATVVFTSPPQPGRAAELTQPTPAEIAAAYQAGWLTYADTDARLVYEGGNWSRLHGVAGAEGGSLTSSADVGARVSIAFEGQGIELLYAAGAEGGLLEGVLLDDDHQEVQYLQGSGMSGSPTYGLSLSFANLTEGHYTLRITNLSGTIWIDGVRVFGQLADVSQGRVQAHEATWVTYDDTDAYLQYSAGDWIAVDGIAQAEGGGLTYTTTPGATLRFRFRGVGVQLVYSRGPEGGTFEVDSEAGPWGVQSTYAEAYSYRHTVMSYEIPDGEHTLTVTNGKGAIWIEAIRVVGELLPYPEAPPAWTFYQDTDPRLAYDASAWHTLPLGSASGGELTYTSVPGAVVSARFEGTGVAVVYAAGPDGGRFQAQVDGEVSQTVDASAVTYSYGHRLVIDQLPAGVHTLTVTNGQDALWLEALEVQGDLLGEDPAAGFSLLSGSGCDFTPTTPAELVTAVNDANSTPTTHDTICLEESTTYLFTSGVSSTNALSVVTTPITVEGNQATLERQSGAPVFRFFEVSSTGALILNDLTLTRGATIHAGGAIHNAGGIVELNNSTFTLNTANTGGVLDNQTGSGVVTLNNCTLSNNTASYGGALDNDLGTNNQMFVNDSTFTNNTASNDGGAIHNDGGTLTLTDTTLTGNTASYYGGGIRNDGTLTLNGGTLSGNIAVRGGGVYNDSSLTLSGGVVIENNQATTGDGWGGGLFNTSTGTVTMSSAALRGNAARYGGAIRNHGSLTVTGDTLLQNNTATLDGAGIYNVSSTGIAQLTGIEIRGNTATQNGGGIYNTTSAQLTLTGSVIEDNQGVNGGGIRNSSTMTVTDSQLLNNTGTTQGGAVYSSSSGVITTHNTCISGNSITAVYASSTGQQDFTGNFWGAADGPSGSGPGSGDSVNNKINYANFLSACAVATPTPTATPTDTPTPTETVTPTFTPTPTATLWVPTSTPTATPGFPDTMVCRDWREGSSHDWVDVSQVASVVWDTNGMYADGSGGSLEASVYYQMPSAGGPWEMRFTTHEIGSFVVAQGAAAPTVGSPLTETLPANSNGAYSITQSFVQLRWTIDAPVQLPNTTLFETFCYLPIQVEQTNQPPQVSAGADQIILWPQDTALLDGTATDDELPYGGLFLTWTMFSGPGTAVFSDGHLEDPSVTFSQPGVYLLRLTASDEEYVVSDTLSVRVKLPADLRVDAVDTSALQVNGDTLVVSGTISADIRNTGEAPAAISFIVTFFEDGNGNGLFDAGMDPVLGTAALPDLDAGAATTVTAAGSGTLAFAGSPVYAFVDSANVVAESDETNNINSAGSTCQDLPPAPGTFAPILEWEWPTPNTPFPESNKVWMTPAVADLNQDGTPDIVFVSFQNGGAATGYSARLMGGMGTSSFPMPRTDWMTGWDLPLATSTTTAPWKSSP